METTQLTAAQIAELKKLQALQSEVSALDAEIDLLDAGIAEDTLTISSLEQLKVTELQLRDSVMFQIRNECDRIKNNKAARSCRAEKMAIIDELNRKVLGLGDNQKLVLTKRSAKQANKTVKVNARSYKKTQVANSILSLANQGIDARSNLAGSVLNGIANVAGAVGGAVAGKEGQNYALPGQARTIPEVIGGIFNDPETGKADAQKIMIVVSVVAALIFGFLIIRKRKK